MKVDLKDKVAVVTGAAGAIGGATARLFAQNGGVVYMNDVNAERLKVAVEEMNAQGMKATGLAGDVRSGEDMEKLIGTAADRCGRIDILVNNAGFNVGNEWRKPVWEYDADAWRRTLDICIDSVYNCCRFTLPFMIKEGGGRIVNIGSVAGWRAPLRLQSPYSTAKSAILNLTNSLAIDYARHGVNVNSVVPGSIMNDHMGAIIYDDAFKNKSMTEHIAAGHTGEPVDIANAVLFLVSPEARYVTGCTVNVDGGWTAGYAMNVKQA